MIILHSVVWKPAFWVLSFLYSIAMFLFFAKRQFPSKKYIPLHKLNYKP
ncbi:hypothetical protein [Anaerocolumna xylanovorans]|nr:hypothetical protein [Anaerocolumna xylanovorans]